MSESEFGIEHLTDEDRRYAGSRYREVVDAVFANPYQKVWGGAGEPPLPIYEVTLGRLFQGGFVKASARALDSAADLRWGPDRKGFRRLVHPNGVCLTGRWRISESTPYSGHFAGGSDALAVARYSTCCTRTERGEVRSLAMVGKLFPTTNPDHPTPIRTADFITQEDIGGASTVFVNDAELRNAPDVTVSRRKTGAPLLLAVAASFNIVDKEPSIRQVYPIAELGKPADQPTRAPQFMRLMMAPHQPKIPGDKIDVRDEIMAQIFDRGDPAPKRTLTFSIEVTDEGETSGPNIRLRRTFKNWRSIGTLTLDNAVISYNGDCVIHFRHPTWRADRNDAATATRIDGEKVR